MNLPNLLTLIRILLIPLFIYFLLKKSYEEATVVFALGSITDGLDGFFARKLHQVTRLGKILDPLADKLFLLGSYSAAYMIGIMPLWLLGLTALKEVTVLSGFAILMAAARKVEIRAIFLGKATTAAQMATLLFILFGGLGLFPEKLLPAVFMLTSGLIILSTLAYVKEGITIYREVQ